VDEKCVKYLVRKPEETIWETQEEVDDDDNTEIELKYIGFKGLELIHPFENSVQWKANVKLVRNFRIPYKARSPVSPYIF
jgi:hypothetical protein